MITPNFIYLLVAILFFCLIMKSFIDVTAVLAVPWAYLYTFNMDARIAIAAVILAGIYTQVVIILKGKGDGFRFDKRFFGR